MGTAADKWQRHVHADGRVHVAQVPYVRDTLGSERRQPTTRGTKKCTLRVTVQDWSKSNPPEHKVKLPVQVSPVCLEMLTKQQQGWRGTCARAHLSCGQRDATLLQVACNLLQLRRPAVADPHCWHETLQPHEA